MADYETVEGGIVPIKAWTRGVPVEDVARKQLVETAWDAELRALALLVRLGLAERGASLPKIMRQSRHKSERMAMTYIRPATLFDDNAADGMGDDEPEGKQ